MTDVFDELIERVLEHRNPEVRELIERGGLYDNVATAVRGRQIQVRGQWLADFASCNYLGLDLRREMVDAIVPEIERWGTHPSWARLCCSPELYETLERKLAQLLGVEETIVLPTITLIGIGLIPAIAGKGGAILTDRFVHKVNHDGCRLARDMGATLDSFEHSDLADLDRKLAARRGAPVRLVVVDGVLSVTGRTPDLASIVEVVRRHDAILYIDDAHGFGVLGERPTSARPYGHRGNGVVQHLGLGYDNILYVAGLSKAYSSLAAFVACPTKLKSYFKSTITAYAVSGPVPTAALATAIRGLELNDTEGDDWRDVLYRYSTAIADAYRKGGIPTDNDNGFPIVSAYVGSAENVLRGGQLLLERGINLTLQGYPLVPRDRGVLRATPTVANTWGEIEQLTTAMREVFAVLRSEGRL